jgi:hypothetical protein
LDATGVENNLDDFLDKVVPTVSRLARMKDINVESESGGVPLCDEEVQGLTYVT